MFLKVLSFLFICSLICYSQEKPNVIFIMSDDHTSEAISAYNSHLKDFAKTPHIDRIANEGMIFNNTFCNNSICSPSRASILTGQYSHINGVLNLNQGILETSPVFTEEFKTNHYQTWLVGKWHIHSTPRGFDKYKVVKGQGEYFNPVFYDKNNQVEKVTGYSSDVYTDVALDWLDKRDFEKPFCLLLHFKAPHHDYSYPERHNQLLKDVVVPEPNNLYEDVENSNSYLKKEFLKKSKFHLSRIGENNDYYERHVDEMEPHDKNDNRDKWRVAYQHMIKTYIRCVTAVDENVGRVLDYLDENNLSENTIVVYTADQGYWLGQHGFYDKRLIMEESFKMPLLIRYPKKVRPKTQANQLCSNIDFAPTLLDMCDLNISKKIQGMSFKNILYGHDASNWREAIYYRYYASPSHTGIRTKTHTMAVTNGNIDLYDLEKDRSQMHNLSHDEKYQPLIAKLQNDLKQYEKKIDYSESQVQLLAKKNKLLADLAKQKKRTLKKKVKK